MTIVSILIALFALLQFAMAVLYFRRLLRGFRTKQTEFASHVYERGKQPGAYWGFMAFYGLCIFATLLIGLLLTRLI